MLPALLRLGTMLSGAVLAVAVMNKMGGGPKAQIVAVLIAIAALVLSRVIFAWMMREK